jgi:hypothetical protein
VIIGPSLTTMEAMMAKQRTTIPLGRISFFKELNFHNNVLHLHNQLTFGACNLFMKKKNQLHHITHCLMVWRY